MAEKLGGDVEAKNWQEQPLILLIGFRGALRSLGGLSL